MSPSLLRAQVLLLGQRLLDLCRRGGVLLDQHLADARADLDARRRRRGARSSAARCRARRPARTGTGRCRLEVADAQRIARRRALQVHAAATAGRCAMKLPATESSSAAGSGRVSVQRGTGRSAAAWRARRRHAHLGHAVGRIDLQQRAVHQPAVQAFDLAGLGLDQPRRRRVAGEGRRRPGKSAAAFGAGGVLSTGTRDRGGDDRSDMAVPRMASVDRGCHRTGAPSRTRS